MEESESIQSLQEEEQLLLEKLRKVRLRKEEITKSVLGKRPNPHYDPSEIPVKKKRPNRFPTYEKHPGTVNHGDEYQILMCILYALKLSINDDVIDFEMTANDNKYGFFRDIKLYVTFKNGNVTTFLFQLKHKDNENIITQNELFSKQGKGDISIAKCFESLSGSNVENYENTIFILYTNRPTNIQAGISSNDILVEDCLELDHKDLISNPQDQNSNSVHQFRSSKTNQTVYFFTKQRNITDTKNIIKDDLYHLLQCDIYNSLTQFMNEWWSGNFTLNKHDFIAKVTELAFSPYLKVLSANNSNEKTENLVKAIMDFELTIIKNDENDIVGNIWSNLKTFDKEEYVKTVEKFRLSSVQESNLNTTKILWHMSKVPLIVKVQDSNKESVIAVINFLRKSCEDKKIILIGNISRSNCNEWTVFENLSDLMKIKKNEAYCHDILKYFNISLQGRDSISIDKFLKIDKEFANILEIQHLLTMSLLDLVIGEKIKPLPHTHIPRNIIPHCIRTENVLKYCERNIDNSLVIINCDKTFEVQWKHHTNINMVELSDYLNKENVQKNEKGIILSTATKCTILDFEKVYRVTKKRNVHLLQVLDDQSCILLLNKGQPLQSENKNIMNVKEEHVHQYFNNHFNVFCAPPGMGKTTMMKVLYNSTPSENWAVYVNLIKHNKFLSQKPTNETILNKLLDLETEQHSLVKQFKMICLKEKKLHIYLDGLDEVDSSNVNFIISFIKYVSSQGINIWVSSRENLREKLSQDLRAIPIEIQELNEEQQKNYIRKRLAKKFSIEKIEKIMNAIFNSSDINNSRDLLGIPLQLHIITEMFLTNDDAFKNLEKQNLFVLTQMYRLYFEGKKKTELNKLGLDEQIEYQLGINYENILEQYEIPALRTCLDEGDYKILEPDKTKEQNFLLRIKEKGDKYGIIKTVDENGETVFIHQTYAEYFACSWLKKNLEKARLLHDRIFSQRYENLRLMFDVMLAENNPLHLAIIYKNMEQFEKNIQHYKEKDCGGRTALCLASMYGARYTKKPKLHRGGFYNQKYYYSDLKRESKFYTNIIKTLLQHDVNLKDRDHLFGLDCIQYSLRSKCLFPIEMMLETKKLNFAEYKEIIFEFYEPEVLVEYAAQFGYSNLFVHLSKNMSYITESKARELLEFAILGTKDDVYTISRPGNNSVVNILIQNHHPNLNCSNESYSQRDSYSYALKNNIGVLDFACKYGCYDVFETLIQNGGKCSDGNTILHSTAKYGTFKEIVIEVYETLNKNQNSKDTHLETAVESTPQNVKKHLERILIKDDKNIFNNTLHKITQTNYMNKKTKNIFKDVRADINVCNYNRQTALHLACEKGWDKIAKKLIENGMDVNIVDNDNNNALHYASRTYQPNQKLLSMLIDAGLDVNATNKSGQTALHLACKKGYDEIAKKLIENGADVNILDNDNNNALHYVMKRYIENQRSFAFILTNKPDQESLNILSMLINVGLDVNARNKSGQTALHLVCQQRKDEIAKKLIENGADVNILDNDNNNALHYASRAYPTQKLLMMLIDAGLDVNARNKSGQTALHLACEEGYDEIAKKLIENGADVNILDKDNNNPLHYASRAYKQNLKLLTMLIDKGVDVNVRNKTGQIALHLACEKGSDEIAKKLIENSSDINTLDTHNNSMLHYASKCNRENIIILQNLICFGLEVNVKNIRNETPLHLTCKSGVIENFTELISRKAKPSMSSSQRNLLHYAAASNNTDLLLKILNLGFKISDCDIYGASALHIACKYGNIDSIKKLIQHGADIHAVNNKNMAALHYATLATKHQEEVIKYLLELGIDSQAKDANRRNAMDCALEKERYLAIQIFIENNIFWETFNTGNVMFLYCSVYSGSNKGVELFLNSYENVDDVDIYNEKYPLHFASKNGQLDAEIVQNLTTFVQKLIKQFQLKNIKYTRQGFIDYLKLQERKYDDIDFIFREAQFSFFDYYKLIRWKQRCNEIRQFLEDYCEKHVNTKTPADSDDDF